MHKTRLYKELKDSLALRCLVWVNDFTTEAQRYREKYKITLDSIKIPLCLCVSVVNVR